MADGFVQLPTDGSGKKLLTEDLGVPGHVQQVKDYAPATFVAYFDRILPAANKYMATLFNTTATRIVKVHGVWCYVPQTTAVAGVLQELEFRKITARTAGTAVTPSANDSNDTLTAGITASHADTVVTDGQLLHRFYRVTEENVVPPTTAITAMQMIQYLQNWGDWNTNQIWPPPNTPFSRKALTLRQNQGVTVKNITGAVASTGISTLILFTDEPV